MSQEIVRVYLMDDGKLDVRLAAFTPPEPARSAALAEAVATAVMRALGGDVMVRDFARLNRPTRRVQ